MVINMKHKLLLVGKNTSAITDFFVQMDESFECLSSSLFYMDIIGHIKYFKPDALVFCMSGESKEHITTMISVHFYLEKTKTPLMLLCDPEDFELLKRYNTYAVDYIMLKPTTPRIIEENILKFLSEEQNEDENNKINEDVETNESDESSEPVAPMSSTADALDAVDAAIKEALSSSSASKDYIKDDPQVSLQKLKTGEISINEFEQEGTTTEISDVDENSEKTSHEKKRILIIDDSPTMLKAINELLKHKYEVATAINGKIGLRYLQNKKVDLILLDYEMPNMSGPEVFQALAANPETADIPIVFLTGVNDASKIQKALLLKPQGYLLKPVDRAGLLSKLSELLD